jgi:predicted Zn-dependent protease with MMP-like domain
VNRRRFERLVEQAVASLPAEVRGRIENVAVLVEDEPTDEQIAGTGLDPETDTLYGLYEGTPLSERGHDFAMSLPDRITLFYLPLVEDFPHPEDHREEIRDTIIHEVAHFLGLEEDEIDDLGY